MLSGLSITTYEFQSNMDLAAEFMDVHKFPQVRPRSCGVEQVWNGCGKGGHANLVSNPVGGAAERRRGGAVRGDEGRQTDSAVVR